MKLKIRYENEYQTIELDTEATENLWVSLSLEGEGLSQEEKEQRIQNAWDEQFNRPEYNKWHQFDRHRGQLQTPYRKDDEAADDTDGLDTVADYTDEIERNRKADYEAQCQWVREILAKKQDWAAAFIAVRLDGMSVNDYADSIKVKDASKISHWLKRAEKKLQENYPNRQI